MNSTELFFDDRKYTGVAILLQKDFTIIKANELFLSLSGYSTDEITKLKFIDMIVSKEKSFFLDVLYNNIITQDITVQLYHKTGAYRFFSLVVLTFDTYFMVIGNEIRREFKSYDNLEIKENLELIQSIFQSLEINDIKEYFSGENKPLDFVLDILPLDVWVKDKYHKYIYVNETFTEHTGHKKDAIIGKSDYEIFEKEIADEFVTSDVTTINSKTKMNYVFESKSDKLLTWTDVTKIPLFNKNGVYIGIIGFSIDITSSKIIEYTLELERKRTQNMLMNIPGIVFEIGTKGDVIYLAGGLKKEFDLSPEYAAQRFVLDRNDDLIVEKIDIALKGQEVSFNTFVGSNMMKFTLTPTPNKDGTFNLIGLGQIVKEDSHE